MKELKIFNKELKRNEFRVTIFGSARIKKNSKIYKQVYDLGKEIGELGFDLVTGGGPGTMEAADQGHQEGNKDSKAHTVGLAIILPKKQKINDAVEIKRKFNRFSERLDNFMLLSNVIIVCPGGVGTLLELLYTWQLLQVKQLSHIPVILLGNTWKGFIKWINDSPLESKFLNKKDIKLLHLTKNNKEAMDIVKKAHKLHLKGKYKNNYK
jgi:uncharacterized protein (TIGR00730 family)